MTDASAPPGEPALWRRAALAATRIVGLVLLLGTLVLALVGRPDALLAAGTAAPPIAPVRSLDGRLGAIDVAAGKVTVVNFWATWCAPCLRELPAFVRASAKYAGRVRFLGLAVESPPEDLTAMVARLQVPYDVAHVDETTTRAWRALSLPTTYILDADGRIAWSVSGGIDDRALDQALAPLLAMR